MALPVSEIICVALPSLYLHIRDFCLPGLHPVNQSRILTCPGIFLLWPISGLYYHAILFPIHFFLFPAIEWQLPLSVFAVSIFVRLILFPIFSYLSNQS